MQKHRKIRVSPRAYEQRLSVAERCHAGLAGAAGQNARALADCALLCLRLFPDRFELVSLTGPIW